MNTIRSFIDAATAGMSRPEVVLATLITMAAVALASSLIGHLGRPLGRWSVALLARRGMHICLVRHSIWVGCMAELPDGTGGLVAEIFRRPGDPSLILLEDCFLADGDSNGPQARVVPAADCTRMERQTFRRFARAIREVRAARHLQDGGKS